MVLVFLQRVHIAHIDLAVLVFGVHIGMYFEVIGGNYYRALGEQNLYKSAFCHLIFHHQFSIVHLIGGIGPIHMVGGTRREVDEDGAIRIVAFQLPPALSGYYIYPIYIGEVVGV